MSAKNTRGMYGPVLVTLTGCRKQSDERDTLVRQARFETTAQARAYVMRWKRPGNGFHDVEATFEEVGDLD